ncbi:MAG: hypothetical protein MZU91_00305 [Desulfosudis oleivorans]|nr:hypothetical protein [Desulfosudis oleivorans]
MPDDPEGETAGRARPVGDDDVLFGLRVDDRLAYGSDVALLSSVARKRVPIWTPSAPISMNLTMSS